MTWPGNLIDNRPIQNVDNKLRLKKMQGKKLAKEFGIKNCDKRCDILLKRNSGKTMFTDIQFFDNNMFVN